MISRRWFRTTAFAQVLFLVCSFFLISHITVFAADTSALTAAINAEYSDGGARTTHMLTVSDYTNGSWNSYDHALSATAPMIESDPSATQGDITNAVALLASTKSGLVFSGASLLVSVNALAASKVQSDYSASSWTAFQSALTATQALPQTSNSEVITKTSAITSAMLLLGTDTSVLTSTITAEIGADHTQPTYVLPSANYMMASWNTYVTALTQGIAAETNTSLTQTAIDVATLTITNAKAALVPISSKAITSFSIGTGTGVIYEGAHIVTVYLPLGTPVTNLTATFTTTGVSLVTGGVTQVSGVTANDFTLSHTYTVTAADASTQDYTVLVHTLGTTQALPDGGGSVTITGSTTEVVGTNQNTVVTIASNASSSTLNLSALISNGTGVLPQITITAQNASGITGTIPTGTTITNANTAWDGILSLPVVTSITLPVTSGLQKTLDTAISIGLSTQSLTFDKGVRIVFPGKGGEQVGYAHGIDPLTEITATCSSDAQSVGDALAANTECKITSGPDLVVWTKHFTTFAVYTQSSISAGGGGGYSASAYTPNIVNSVVATSTATSTQSIATLAITAQARQGQVLGISTYVFLKNLQMGQSGASVTELQKVLAQAGFLKEKPTGYFGPLTKKALMKWQTAHKLPSVGSFGPLTRALLNKAATE